jgi:hypothetical protein
MRSYEGILIFWLLLLEGVEIRGHGHLVYGVVVCLEGENSTSGPQPYRAEITNQITPQIPTLPFGNRSLQTPLFFETSKLPYEADQAPPSPRLPSSRGLSTDMLTFIYRLSWPEAIHGLVAMLLCTVCPRPRLSTVGTVPRYSTLWCRG